MEKPGEPDHPLLILHHDEHLAFPGYDVMVGNGGVAQHQKDEHNPWAAGNLEAKGETIPHGRRDEFRMGLYKRHEKLFFVVAIIWCAAPFSISCLCRSRIHLFKIFAYSQCLDQASFSPWSASLPTFLQGPR